MSKISHLVLFTLLLLVNVGANAEWIPIEDQEYRILYYRVTYTAHEDFTHDEIHTAATKVLNKRAIRNLKERTVSYSTSVEKIDIIDAYNIKADGKRIDAPKDNYQVRTNKGRGEDGPVFSDRASITTVFPEVEVGDTLVFTYKRTTTEPMFPKYFTAARTFPKSVAYDEVTIDLTVPASFDGLHQTRELTEQITKGKDTTHYHWTWQNKNPMRDTRKDYSVWDMESTPGFTYSTFDSYKAIAEAYAARALPKVVVSQQISELADKIVGDEKDKKEQARLLYEWVATKITYSGNCVGVGAVVPHDLSFILDNHMGDCKDHATLLQALLAAKDIKSEQALINSGNVFELPKIPVINSVNHVINYLPEWNLFVDSTDPDTPFGMLPSPVEGKPVLLVENFVDGMKTPVSGPNTHMQQLNADIEILPDGSASGRVEVKLHGAPAVIARSGWRNISKDDEDQWLKDLFTQNGKIGSAAMEKDNPEPLRDRFNYSMTFEQKEFVLTDSAGGFPVYSPTPSYFSAYELVWVPEQIEEQPIACSSGKSEETYVYRFPQNFKILDVPKDKIIDGEHIHYEAHYTLSDNVLTVVRVMEDTTPGPICSPELIASQKTTLQKISRNLRAQIVYKPLLEDE